jgi:hypothetical protein
MKTKSEKTVITMEKNPNGSLTFYAMVNNHLFHHTYYLYSKTKALADFKRQIKKEKLSKK